ncbi:MAG: hypothetical protein NTV39_04515 [Candidatus Saccharibacteria bacterium]|nr:hypothetical protein [Candidatus Saccharibacteria bacterium]
MNITLLSNTAPVVGVDDFDSRRSIRVSIPFMYELWDKADFPPYLVMQICKWFGLDPKEVKLRTRFDDSRIDGIHLWVDKLTYMVMESDFEEAVSTIVKDYSVRCDIEDIVTGMEDSNIGL